ncbi:MAG: TetR/AcrR family transcriptional regulator [Lysinibacillus sp.]
MAQQNRRQKKKMQLKEAALQLFATNGYENTKVSEIVKQVQVSQGTFYWYFQSKEECALEMLDDGGEQLLNSIKQGYRVEKFEVEDALQSTKNIFGRIFNFAKDNRYLMQIILRGIHTQPVLQAKVNSIKQHMEQAFARNIVRAKELGVLRQEVNEHFQAVLIVSLIEGVLIRWLDGDESSQFKDISMEQLIDQTVNFEFYGLFGQQ